MSNNDIILLVKKAREGNNEAKIKIFKNYKGLVINIADRFVKTTTFYPFRNDDFISLSYVGISKAINKFDINNESRNFKSYVIICIRNEILKEINKKRNTEVVCLDEPIPHSETSAIDILEQEESFEDCIIKKDEYRRLHNALNDDKLIKEENKNLIFMYYFLDLTYEEIAKQIGRRSDSISLSIKRSLKKVKKYMLYNEEGKNFKSKYYI